MPPPDRYWCQEDFAGLGYQAHASDPAFRQIPQEIEGEYAKDGQGSETQDKPVRRNLPNTHGIIFFTP
jgi:hypothetical protein